LQDDGKSKSQKGGGGGLGGLFGGRSKASANAPTGPQKQKKIDSKLVEVKPAGKEVCYSSLLQLTSVSLSVRLSTAGMTVNSSETRSEPIQDNRGAYIAQSYVASQHSITMLMLVSEDTPLSTYSGLHAPNTYMELGRQSPIQSCWWCLMTEHVMQRGGFGQLFGGKKQQEEEEQEEDSAPQNPLAGLFGGAKKAKVCRTCFPRADWPPVTRVCYGLVQRAMPLTNASQFSICPVI